MKEHLLTHTELNSVCTGIINCIQCLLITILYIKFLLLDFIIKLISYKFEIRPFLNAHFALKMLGAPCFQTNSIESVVRPLASKVRRRVV